MAAPKKKNKDLVGNKTLNPLKDLKLETTKIDMKKWYEDREKERKKEEERKAKEAMAEEVRVKNLGCPVCKSTKKYRHTERTSNGIIGPGYSSRIVSDYYICTDCGVHYSDLNKKEK